MAPQEIRCPYCQSRVKRKGFSQTGTQRYQCLARDCRRTFHLACAYHAYTPVSEFGSNVPYIPLTLQYQGRSLEVEGLVDNGFISVYKTLPHARNFRHILEFHIHQPHHHAINRMASP